MKLYFSPFACSLSPHIVLRELGYDFDLVKVDLRGKTTSSGENFLEVNSKGYVPALRLDNGEVLTEGPAITQYLADQRPEKGLVPAAGTLERARLQEWLTFIGTELHKGFGALFAPGLPDEVKAATRERLGTRLTWTQDQLKGKAFLMGDNFSVADAYLFTVLNWPAFVGMDLANWPGLAEYHARVGARPAVGAAVGAEMAARQA